ncbi:MAG: hypothetical protein NVSMB3_09250 [Acidobacteriaceae bacterium]
MLLLAGSGLLLAGSSLTAQQMGNLSAPAKSMGYVSYAAEPQMVKAGKAAVVELHFQVLDGFHINSHTPKSELLIPTAATFQPAAGVKAGAVQYPPGTAYSFSFEPTEKLDVYSGAFTVKVPVVAVPGEHRVEGALRYQACDHAACYPPKTLPVDLIFTAK